MIQNAFKEGNEIFNLKYHYLSKNETIDEIKKSINSGEMGCVRGDLNVASICMAAENPKFKILINDWKITNIDGMGVIFALKLLGLKCPERIAGVDLFVELVEMAEAEGLSIYLVGAKHETIKNTVECLIRKHPRIQIVGFRNGYFNDESEVIDEIIQIKPDMVFIGMPSPKKELFADNLKKENKIPFIMGVGGTFDVISGEVKRAPGFIQKCGFEWFYRLMQEPGRLWKRYLFTNTIFGIMVVKEYFKLKER